MLSYDNSLLYLYILDHQFIERFNVVHFFIFCCWETGTRTRVYVYMRMMYILYIPL